MEQTQNPSNSRCTKCGTAILGETTGGLCPRCLMEMNLASRTMPGGEASPQVPPPSPGEIADSFPQFEIVECLGRGGMGVVYKARQKSLDRWVAIKLLAPERVHDERFAEHFEREAKTLAKLSHPNIVTVFDHGEADGLFYIVMEFVDGVNLRDLLMEGKMEPAQALAIVPEICAALQFAHDHGVVHRDIKPENILIDRVGRVKIADFGIAALVGTDADRSGTPPYMAPEQETAGGTIDHRADIYALGVVLYEMLTGERPDQDLPRPSQRVEIDVRLDEVVLRALEKEPSRRYQTAGEFRTVVRTMVASKVERADEPSFDSGNKPRGMFARLRWLFLGILVLGPLVGLVSLLQMVLQMGDIRINEIALLLIFVTFGLLVGIGGGIVAARRGKKLIHAIISSALVAVVVPLVFWFAWTTIDAMIVRDKSFGRALGAGIYALFILVFAVPFLSGLPALSSAVVSYFVARRCCARRTTEPCGVRRGDTCGSSGNYEQYSLRNSLKKPTIKKLAHIAIVAILVLGGISVCKPHAGPPKSIGQSLGSAELAEGVGTEALILALQQNGFETIEGKTFEQFVPDDTQSRAYSGVIALRDTTAKYPNEIILGVGSDAVFWFESHNVSGDAIADWEAHVQKRIALVERLAANKQ